MKANPTGYLRSKYECFSDEWLSKYGLLENFNASVTRTRTCTGTRTGTGTGTWTTGVIAIALCTLCSRAKNGTNSTIGRFTDFTIGRTPNVASVVIVEP